MAAKLEKDPLQVRKVRLIKQNEMHREDLLAEAENLRGAAEWIERGYVFMAAAGDIRKWVSPTSKRGHKKRTFFAKVLRGCALGLRVWKNFSKD